jgi:hypothetical protein
MCKLVEIKKKKNGNKETRREQKHLRKIKKMKNSKVSS